MHPGHSPRRGCSCWHPSAGGRWHHTGRRPSDSPFPFSRRSRCGTRADTGRRTPLRARRLRSMRLPPKWGRCPVLRKAQSQTMRSFAAVRRCRPTPSASSRSGWKPSMAVLRIGCPASCCLHSGRNPTPSFRIHPGPPAGRPTVWPPVCQTASASQTEVA